MFHKTIFQHERENAFKNACKHGHREIAKLIYDVFVNENIDLFSGSPKSMLIYAIHQLIRKGHLDMLNDYRECILNSNFSEIINNYVLLFAPNFNTIKVLDLIGTGIVCCKNFKYAIRSECINNIMYFHKKGIILENQHLLYAEHIQAHEIVTYFSENGFTPSTEFYKKYVTFRKKIKAKRIRYLANMVYYVLIQKIYTPGSDSANRLALASYNNYKTEMELFRAV